MSGNIPPSRFEGKMQKIQITKLRTKAALENLWRGMIYCPVKHQKSSGQTRQRPVEIDPRPDVRYDGAAEFEDPLITPFPAEHDLVPLPIRGDDTQDPQAPSLPSAPVAGNYTTPEKHLHSYPRTIDIKTSRQSFNRPYPDSLEDRKASHHATTTITSGSVVTRADEGKESINYLEMKAETALGFPRQAGNYDPSDATQNFHYDHARHSSPSLPVSTIDPPGYLEISADDPNHQLPPGGGTFHRSYMWWSSTPSESSIPPTDAQLRTIRSILQSLPTLEPEYRRDEVLQSFYLLRFTLGEAGILRLFSSEDEYEQVEGVLNIPTEKHKRLIHAFEEGRDCLIDLLKRRDITIDQNWDLHEEFAIKQVKRCFRILGLRIWRVRPMLSEGPIAI